MQLVNSRVAFVRCFFAYDQSSLGVSVSFLAHVYTTRAEYSGTERKWFVRIYESAALHAYFTSL